MTLQGDAFAAAGSGKVVELRIALRRDELAHFLGYPPARSPSPRFLALLVEAEETARLLARPRGVLRRLPVAAAGEVGLEPIAAAELVIGLATIGPELERGVTDLLTQGEPTRALLLDAAGSAAVEETADRLSASLLGAREADDGAPVACRISPGYGRWKLAAQAALFSRLPHRELGVALTSRLLMTPRKSISFALWLDAAERPLAGLAGCARCPLPTCRYRRSPFAGSAP